MRQVSRKEITDVQEREYVQTYGKVIPTGKTLIAPLSGLECVYYYVEVWNGIPGNYRSVTFSLGGLSISKDTYGKSAKAILKEHSEEPFYIESNGAKAIVSDALRLPDNRKMVYESGLFDSQSPNMLAYFERYGINPKTILGTNTALVCYEWIIPVGAFITLKGQGYWVGTEANERPLNDNRVLRISKGDKKYIYVDYL